MSRLEFSSLDHEPFLRLPAPCDALILTPPRYSDGELHQAYLNDPRVYNNLIGPPFPYHREDWEKWYPAVARGCQRSLNMFHPNAPLRDLERVDSKDYDEPWSGEAPVRSIREIDPQTGEQKFIGDLTLRKCSFVDVLDEAERKRLVEENEAWPVKDKRIVWEFGYFLAPSHHGRGIMTVAIRCFLDNYAIPDLNVQKMRCTYFGHNTGSRRVMEKNGFVYQTTIPKAVTMQESKGGGKLDLGVLTWTKEDDD